MNTMSSVSKKDLMLAVVILHHFQTQQHLIAPIQFLSDPGVPGLGSGLWVWLSQQTYSKTFLQTDVTLAAGDTNSIPTDNANGAFQGNVAMRMTQPSGQLWNQAMQVALPDDQILNECKLCHLVVQFSTDAGGQNCN